MTAEVNQLIHVLEQLQVISYDEPAIARKINAYAVDALHLIFHIGSKQINLTEQQKKAIAKYLVSAFKPIQINIEGDGFEFGKVLRTFILKKRSALQFLLDNYGTFHTDSDDKTLSKVFEQVNLKETIEILDEIIKDNCTTKDLDNESDSGIKYFVPKFSGIPPSHTWWF